MKDLRLDALSRLRYYLRGQFEPWVSPEGERGRASFGINPIVAMNLARLTRIPAILPTALYVFCQLPVHLLLRGNHQPDDDLTTLSKGDLVRCVEGKVRLTAGVTSIPWTITTTGLDLSDCTAKGRCLTNLKVWAGYVTSTMGASCDALAPCPLIARAEAEQARAAHRGDHVLCSMHGCTARPRDEGASSHIREIALVYGRPRYLGTS